MPFGKGWGYYDEVMVPAIESLRKLRATEATEPLIACVARGDSSGYRAQGGRVPIVAAGAVLEIGDESSGDKAVRVLLNRVDCNLRATEGGFYPPKYAAGLGKASTAALTHALDDDHSHIRGAATAVLAELGDLGSVQLFVRMIDDPEEDVRRQAVEGLTRLGDPDAVPILIAALEKDESYRIRSAAAAGIGELCYWLGGNRAAGPAAIGPLVAALTDDEDWLVRMEAARSLGKLGHGEPDSRVTNALTCAIKDDEPVRKEATEALRRWTHEDPASRSLLCDDCPGLKRPGF